MGCSSTQTAKASLRSGVPGVSLHLHKQPGWKVGESICAWVKLGSWAHLASCFSVCKAASESFGAAPKMVLVSQKH